jgi:thiopurine S-methyltransferase
LANQWIDRWEQGNTGWHEMAGNARLKQHWRGTGKHVLVPFCGKSKDMLWLEEQGNKVAGVELSELAIEAFFDENELEFTVRVGTLKAFQAKTRQITIYCGDYFALQTEPFDAHFDRGALVALPPDRRPAYAAHTSSLLAGSAQQLVITLEYDQSVVAGPPFSVEATEVRSYWPALQQVAAEDDIANGPPKFREAGLKEMTEVIWRSS